MAYPKAFSNPHREQIKLHERNISQIRKALSLCDDNFPYKPDIESCRTEEYAQMGHCHYKAGCFKEAINVYSRAIATDPNHFQALFQLALSHTALQQYEDARDCLHEIIERTQHTYDLTHRLDAQLQIARTYLAESKETSLKKAEQYIVLVSKTQPNHPQLAEIANALQQKQYLFNLIQQARINLEAQNWRQANTILRELKRLAPQDLEVRQMETILRETVANNALVGYNKTLFQSITLSSKQPSEDMLSSLKSTIAAG